jgi:hypothetical protein
LLFYRRLNAIKKDFGGKARRKETTRKAKRRERIILKCILEIYVGGYGLY